MCNALIYSILLFIVVFAIFMNKLESVENMEISAM